MRLDFETVDVFTDSQFGGNPLAVVLNAEGLSGAQMQAIAGEFNLSETTFVLPPKDPNNTAHVRIFTPRYEMPFAGHPNVGTGFVLARRGVSYGREITGDTLLFEEQAGIVRIDVTRKDGHVSHTQIAAPQVFSVGANVPVELILSACGLPLTAIATAAHQPCIASCGAPFILAELTSVEALSAAKANAEVYHRDVAKYPATSIFLYCRDTSGQTDIRARMFAPHHGIAEDPATGAANLALAGLLAQLRPDGELRLELKVAQGIEMGRPSYLELTAIKTEGKTNTFLGGACAPMLTGSFGLR